MDFDPLCKLIMENEAPRSYSCLMLDLSPLKKFWKQLARKICPCDLYTEDDGHGFEHDPHVTVLYGIHSSNSDVIFSDIDLKPITLKFSNISLFENEKFDVLKFDITSKALHGLNQRVCDAVEYTNKFPDYHPHATICYLKAGTGKDYVDVPSSLLDGEVTTNRYIFSTPSGEKTYFDA